MRIRILAAALASLCGLLRAAEGPFHSDPVWDYPALGAGMAAAAAGFISERDIAAPRFDPTGLRRGDIPAYDRWAIGFYSKPLASASDVLILADGLCPLALAGLDLRAHRESTRQAWTELVMYGEVVAYASAISLFSKSSRLHPRPLAFTSAAPLSERESGDARSAFFSEHATGAFAAATFTGYAFQTLHPGSAWIPWVWTGAMGTATAVAALRVFSGKHFPSDVLAGAAAGSAVGYLVPRLHTSAAGGPRATGSKREDASFPALGLSAGIDPGDLSPTLLLTLRIR